MHFSVSKKYHNYRQLMKSGFCRLIIGCMIRSKLLFTSQLHLNQARRHTRSFYQRDYYWWKKNQGSAVLDSLQPRSLRLAMTTTVTLKNYNSVYPAVQSVRLGHTGCEVLWLASKRLEAPPFFFRRPCYQIGPATQAAIGSCSIETFTKSAAGW